MITYKENKNANQEIQDIAVYLGGKRVGTIARSEKGWRYYPNGSLNGGEWFKTIREVKNSLESE